jgi:hypothetical protein
LESEDGEEGESKPDKADEFVRNFFIKFGMKKTLDTFQVPPTLLQSLSPEHSENGLNKQQKAT